MCVTVESTCAECGSPLVLEMDGQQECRVREGGAEPMLFHPLVDFRTLPGPSIIDAF